MSGNRLSRVSFLLLGILIVVLPLAVLFIRYWQDTAGESNFSAQKAHHALKQEMQAIQPPMVTFSGKQAGRQATPVNGPFTLEGIGAIAR